MVPQRRQRPRRRPRQVDDLRGQHLAKALRLPPQSVALGGVAVGATRAPEQTREQVLHLVDAAILREALEDPVSDHVRLARPLPEDVREQKAVELADHRSSVGVRGDAEQGDGFHEAAVADVHRRLALVLEVVAEIHDEVDDAGGHRDVRLRRLLHPGEILHREREAC